MPNLIAYVDGSYDNQTKVYGSGVVLILPSGEVLKYLKGGNNPETAKLRNVSGELIAAMHAVSYAAREGFDSIDIYYDYLGIECWANGTWKAKKPQTLRYKEFIKQHRKEMRITFHKVQAHIGNEYNELADSLAKWAVCNFENEE